MRVRETNNMDALAMRYLGKNTFCVAQVGTSTLLCIECGSFDPRLAVVSPFCPTGVKIVLGAYDIARGVFTGCTITSTLPRSESKKTTAYRRVQ
jgi:hypothetical protein